MKSHVLIFLLFLFTSSTPWAQPNLYFETLSMEDGLSQHSVLSMLRDKNGFLWIGTRHGLNRYDGHEFRVYLNDPLDPTSLSDKEIPCLWEEPAGILWVGTLNGLNRFNTITHKAERFFHDPKNANSLSNNRILSILVDRLGLIWIGTDSGLNVFDYRHKKFQRFFHQADNTHTISQDTIVSLYEDRQGDIWVGTLNGLNHFNRKTKQFTRYYNALATPWKQGGNKIYSILEDRDGTIWTGTARGLYIRSLAQHQLVPYPHRAPSSKKMFKWPVKGMIEDDSGLFWIATDSGLVLFDKHTAQYTQYRPVPNSSKSLQRPQLRSIYRDKEGIVWIGAGLVHKVNPLKRFFLHYTANPSDNNSLSDPEIISIMEDKEGILWIGTLGKGLDRFDRSANQWTHYRHNKDDPQSISSDVVNYLYEDRTGKLWVATRKGLNVLNRKTGKFTRYLQKDTDSNTFNGNETLQVLEDKIGNIWLITRYGKTFGLVRFDQKTGRFNHYKNDPANPSSIGNFYLTCLYEDRKGRLWIGTHLNEGLIQFDPATNTVKRFPNDPGNPHALHNRQIRCIYEDKTGKLWLGGSEGLDVFDPSTKKVLHYGEKDGLPREYINCIEEDKRGRLWISTTQGLTRFDPNTGQFKSFDVSDGLQSLQFYYFSSGYSKKTGELFFGGANGFNIFHPDSIRDNLYKPVVMISKLHRYNSEVVPGKAIEEDLMGSKAITLSYKDQLLSFNLVSLSLTKPMKNLYAYQLKGFSDQWYQLGTQKEITFTGLPPGNYTLLVKGTNGDGVWNETPAALSITILPPWWRTWWAYTFYGSCLIAGFFLINRTQKRRLIRKERERTREKELAQAKAIEEAYNELRRTQAQLIQQELLKSQMEIQEQTLKSVSQEIHDNIGQVLTLIKLNIISINPNEEKNMLEKITDSKDLINKAIQDLRRLSKSLNTDYISQIGLAAAIEQELEQIKKVGMYKTQLTISEQVFQLDQHKEFFLFRIFQEVINNTIKHAHASLIMVSLQYHQNNFVMEITDDGQGFDVTQINDDHKRDTGLGIKSIQTRAKLIGAEVFVQSSLNKGTNVKIILPV